MSENRATAVRLESAPGAGGLMELVFDAPDASVNVLSMSVIDDIDRALDELGHRREVVALLVRSAKEDSFIVGADLNEIARIEEASIAGGHAARVHELFNRLAALPFPVVAAIHGTCLGGGLELALACHARLASDHLTTRMGLPEVKLGLIPGFGGTQRLPRLIGVRRALDLILKGYSVDGAEAERAGLVDGVLPAARFLEAARTETRRVCQQGRVRRRALAFADRVLLAVGPVRDLYFRLAERNVRKSTHGQYPAPEAAIGALREGLRVALDEGLEIEAGQVGALAVSAEAKSLIRLHFAAEALRKNPGISLDLAQPVHKVGVVGAGVMGAGIAALVAEHEIAVRLRDVDLARLGRGMKAMADILDTASRRRHLGRRGAQAWLRQVAPTTGSSGFGSADLVVEAVVEDAAAKRDVFEQLEETMSPDAVLATNTSALSVSELQRSARHPGRIVGMHFFNPVAKMPLVEVVRGDSTNERTLATVVQFARSLGKTPIIVADGPGFFVNRVLAPYLMEALLLVEEGTDPALVEQSMLEFGMPMGPLELIDEVGLDVSAHVAGTLGAAFPERIRPSVLLSAMLAEKRLGRKSGLGFYRHGARNKVLDPAMSRVVRKLGTRPKREPPSRSDLKERLILAMLNEAMRALEEGIVRTPHEADLAVILGAGFPAFRGGLFAFAATLGVGSVRTRLERLESLHGERFHPASLLAALEKRDLGFLEAREVLR